MLWRAQKPPKPTKLDHFVLPNWPHPNTARHLQQSDTWLSQNYCSCWWEKSYSDAAPQAGTFSQSRITQTQHKLMPSTSPVAFNIWGQPNCTDQTHEFTSAPHCPWTRCEDWNSRLCRSQSTFPPFIYPDGYLPCPQQITIRICWSEVKRVWKTWAFSSELYTTVRGPQPA